MWDDKESGVAAKVLHIATAKHASDVRRSVWECLDFGILASCVLSVISDISDHILLELDNKTQLVFHSEVQSSN